MTTYKPRRQRHRRPTAPFDARLSIELDCIIIALDERTPASPDYTWLRLAKRQLEDQAFGKVVRQ